MPPATRRRRSAKHGNLMSLRSLYNDGDKLINKTAQCEGVRFQKTNTRFEGVAAASEKLIFLVVKKYVDLFVVPRSLPESGSP